MTVLPDPWELGSEHASCDPFTFSCQLFTSTGVKGMEKCDDETVADRCYLESGTGYVVYNEWETCQPSWFIIPGFDLLPKWLLIIIYFLTLMWLFLGIGIISDVFMAAIEVITSKEKKEKKKDPATGETVEYTATYWNATIANLTLMALGSSAPEILLAVIETCSGFVPEGKPQKPGELGAATIVGSASFNLLVISAVCIMAIPDGEVRRIKELNVFLTTAFFSVVAYLWVLWCYVGTGSKEYISITEAVITLSMFPILVFLAYAADQNYFRSKKEGADEEDPKAEAKMTAMTVRVDGGQPKHADRQEIVMLLKSGAAKDVVGAMTKEQTKQVWSAARYRINALRGIFGKAYKAPRKESVATAVAPEPDMSQSMKEKAAQNDVSFAFRSPNYSVMENAGAVQLAVMRLGNTDAEATVNYRTEDGTADAGDDYEAAKGTLTFAPGVEVMTISVTIIDDNKYELDENFYVHLEAPSVGKVLTPQVEVTIIDDDEPGVFTFEQFTQEVGEMEEAVEVNVVRKNGADGEVSVFYATKNDTAIAGEDYVMTKGELMFGHGEQSRAVTIPLVNNKVPELHKSFILELSNPQGGASLSKRTSCKVTIVDDSKVTAMADEVAARLAKKEAKLALSSSSWWQQFRDAVVPEGGVDDEGEEVEPDDMSLFIHYCSITWKVIFAMVPPAEYGGGWPCFFVALGFIGGVTAIVEQVATVFGCAIGLNPTTTAITFVALGTSLPDTFASKQAALESETADAAIGNVTGSNSVNVFLGLGLPWVIASAYYESTNRHFQVEAGALGFSVAVFAVCACICLTLLMIRRRQGGELGGSAFSKKASGALLLFLWFMYVLLSALQSYGDIDI